MLIHWIWLATRPEVGDHTKAALLGHFHDPEAIYYAERKDFACAQTEISEKALESLGDKDLTQARRIWAACEAEGIRLLTFQDAAYPARLRSIDDPPVLLYYKGTLPDFDARPLIGVVGTRRATAYGLGVAKRMGYQIAACGGIVVSGLAFGIDGLAMRGALSAGMPVVGVMGCGADIVYPAANESLYADTCRQGCLLTEFPPGTPPMKWNFPKRNRIISGLSCGVLVVEAPARSGALITAHQAADQGRDVFVVPGNIDVESCAGSNALLRDGAIAVSSGWDILAEYQNLFPGKLRREEGGRRMRLYPDELAMNAEPQETKKSRVAQKTKGPGKRKAPAAKKIDVDNPAQPPYSEKAKADSDLSDQERTIVETLGGEISLVDDLIARCGMPAGQVLAALTLLEVKGRVERMPGRKVRVR